MAEDNKKLSDQLNTGANGLRNSKNAVQMGKSAYKSSKKAAKGVISIGKKAGIKVLVYFLIAMFLISAITQGSSILQMNDTFGISPLGDSSFTPNELNEEAVWDKSAAQKRSLTMIDTISEVTADDYQDILDGIESYCKEHDYDVELSLNSIVTVGLSPGDIYYSENENNSVDKNESEKDDETTADNKPSDDGKAPSQVEEGEETDGKVIQSFDLSSLSEANRTTMTYEEFFRRENGMSDWSKGSFQRKFKDANNWRVDDFGLLRSTEESQEDFLIALGSYFGTEGNRYRITFRNGKSYTFLKFDEKADKDTSTGIPGVAHGVDSSVIEFLVDSYGKYNKLHPSMKKGNIINHPLNLFGGGIESIELIEGTVSVDSSYNMSTMSPRILSAYSVSMDNLFYTKRGSQLFNEDGENVTEVNSAITSDYWGSEIRKATLSKDSNKELKKKLKQYAKDHHFFQVNYEKAKSVQEVEVTIPGGYTTAEIDKMLEENENLYEKEVDGVRKIYQKKTITYCIPTITSLDVNSMAEKIFDIDPDEEYINDKDITNREAIDNITTQTSALLFDTVPDGSYIVTDPENTGIFRNPLQVGTYRITQHFGNNGHRGIDLGTGIFANTAPAVYAADGGIVEIADNHTAHSSYGNCVVINHGNGFKTLYAHLSSISVTAGQKVGKGQAIGNVGSTGNSTGPHLHFEITKNGTLQNPESYITF